MSGTPILIAGPCVVESKDICMEIAEALAVAAQKQKVDILFKASYDKANRTSTGSFRGPGREEGLRILADVKCTTGLPIVTDIHEPGDAPLAAQVADVLQIPAFLCRQTDLLIAAGKTGRVVNVKKGQFMAPGDMRYAVDKVGGTTWLTERGTFFGYNRLVVDFAAVPEMKQIGVPLIFDATHSVQSPGGGQGRSSGNRDLAIPLARAALASGYDGLFFEIHPDPTKALCDGPNSLYLTDFLTEMPRFLELYSLVRSWR